MNIFLHSENFVGSWTGTSRLWYPEGVSNDSASTADIVLPSDGKSLSMSYTWEFEGKPQEGALMIDGDEETQKVSIAWMDSWHQPTGALLSEGTIDADGTIDVLGSFSAGEGPDWGWRTTLQSDSTTFKFTMWCIEPDGKSELAVEATYTRV